MRQTLRNVLCPLLSLILLMLSNGYMSSFMSMRILSDGYGEQVVGYVHAAYYAGVLLCSLLIEPLIRRVGHIRSFAVFASLCATSLIFQGIYEAVFFWILMRFLAGVSFAGLWVVIESWLLGVSSEFTRGRVLSVYMMALYISQATGQFFLDFTNLVTTEPFFVGAALCTLSVLPVCLTRAKSPEVKAPTTCNIFNFFSRSPFGYLGCILSGAILSCIYSFAPNFAQQESLTVSWVMSTTILGGVVLQFPLGKLSDLFDRATVLICVSFATMIPSFFILLYPHDLWPVLIASFVLGGLSFTLYPLAMTQVCDRIEPENITAVTSVLLFVYGLGAVIGPLLAPFFMAEMGPLALYPVIGFTTGFLGLFGIVSRFFRKKIPKKEQESYVSLPPTTPIACDMDPRKN